MTGKQMFNLELNPGETVIVSTSGQHFTGDAYAYYQNAGEPNPVSDSWTVSFVQGGPQLPASITVDSLAHGLISQGMNIRLFQEQPFTRLL